MDSTGDNDNNEIKEDRSGNIIVSSRQQTIPEAFYEECIRTLTGVTQIQGIKVTASQTNLGETGGSFNIAWVYQRGPQPKQERGKLINLPTNAEREPGKSTSYGPLRTI